MVLPAEPEHVRMAAGVTVMLPWGLRHFWRPSAAHSRALVLRLPSALCLALWGQRPPRGTHLCPARRWCCLAGFRAQQGSGAQGRGPSEGQAHRCVQTAQRLAWNATTSLLQRDASPGSRFTWHLVMVITAEL